MMSIITTQIVVFTTSGCSYCAKAKRLLSEVAARPSSLASGRNANTAATVSSLDVTAGAFPNNTRRYTLHQSVADRFEHATFPLVVALHHNTSNGEFVLEFIGGYTEMAGRVGKHGANQDLSTVFAVPAVKNDDPQRHLLVLGREGAPHEIPLGEEFASFITSEGEAIPEVPAAPLTPRQKLCKVFGLVDSSSTPSMDNDGESINKIQAVLSEAEAQNAAKQPIDAIRSSTLHPELFVSMYSGWHSDAKIEPIVPRSQAWMSVLRNEARDRMALQQSATMLKTFSLGAVDTIVFVPLYQGNTIVANGPVSIYDLMRFIFYSYQIAVRRSDEEASSSLSVVEPMYLSNGAMPYTRIPQFAEDDLTSSEYFSHNKNNADVTTFLNYRPGFFCKIAGGVPFENEYERRLLGWSRPASQSKASEATATSSPPVTCWDEQLIGANSVQRRPKAVWQQASLFRCVLEPYAALYTAHVAAVANTLSMSDDGTTTKTEGGACLVTMTAESLLEVLLRHDVIRKHPGGATAPPVYRWTGHVAACAQSNSKNNHATAAASVVDILAMPPSRWYASGSCTGPSVEEGGGNLNSGGRGGRMAVPFPPPHLESNTMMNSEVRIIGQYPSITANSSRLQKVSDEVNIVVVASSAALRSVLDVLRDTYGKETLGDSVLLSYHPNLVVTNTSATSGGKGGVQYDALGQSATLAWASSALLAKHLGTYNTKINWNSFFTTSPRPTVTATLINIYNSLVTTKMAAVLGQSATHGKLPSSMMTQYKFFYSPAISFSALSETSASSTLHFSLDDIENGVLRGNRAGVASFLSSSGPFKSNDPRRAWSLQAENVDYRIHAALNCGASSCPPVRVFDAEHLNEQLHTAFTAFVQSTTQLQWSDKWSEETVITEAAHQGKKYDPSKMVPKRTRLPPAVDVNLSMIFKWYKEDFQHPLPTHYSQPINVVGDVEDGAITSWVAKLAHLKDHDRHVLGVVMRYLQPSKRKALLTLPHIHTQASYGDVPPLSSVVKVSYLPYDWSNDAAAVLKM